MSIVNALKKLAVRLGRAQTPEEVYAPDITTALKQVAVGYGVADDPSKVPGSSIDEVIDVLANKIEPGGSGIPFPEITITLNIDHPENVTVIGTGLYERVGNRFKGYTKAYIQGETAPAQSIITGAILPAFNGGSDTDNMNYYGFAVEAFEIVGDGEYRYDYAISNVVNLRDMHDDATDFEVIDPTKPISCTITATRMSFK